MYPFKLFIRQSLKNFIEVGAFLPSSKFLAKRMLKGIYGPVILELGPGTGVFTKEILKRLPDNGLLISIESNRNFFNHLQENIKDKRLKIYNDDARSMRNLLNLNNLNKVDCIISGLPLGNFKKEVSEEILKRANECLAEHGTYVQFQYLLVNILNIKNVFPRIKISYEFFNFPPAFVMKCTKR